MLFVDGFECCERLAIFSLQTGSSLNPFYVEFVSLSVLVVALRELRLRRQGTYLQAVFFKFRIILTSTVAGPTFYTSTRVKGRNAYTDS